MRASTLRAAALASLVMAGCSVDEAQAAVNAAAPAQRTVERVTTRAATESKQNDDASRLQQIADDYFEQYLALHPLRATEIGDHRFDDRFGGLCESELDGRFPRHRAGVARETGRGRSAQTRPRAVRRV